tara:strand:- start:264 stop:479 length:216 start_codon:yes stop_codon:yes gene_type:complete
MEKFGLGLDFLSPSAPLGFIILFIGIIFTVVTFYVFINASTNQESLSEKKSRINKENEQKRKISRLYPKNK